jgi:hypothetical protein
MDLTSDQTPEPSGASPDPLGELIVQNGRLAGTRRALAAPLTLIGRAEGCDIRLNVDGVEPLHCALVNTPQGLVLRDLGGEGTLVNGAPPDAAPLQDGATLAVGPFRFRLHLPPAETGNPLLAEMEALEREREALRVQAAAVVAQQAALGEAEARLEHRQAALQRQEEQLSAHLEERRTRLEELQTRVRESREALRRERAEHEQHTAAQLRDLERTRGELSRASRDAEAERARLHRLRRRLKARSHRHLLAERTALARREEDVAGRLRRLEQETEQLEQGRAALAQERLRFNGEAELGRRRLQDAWDQLYEQQRRGQETREREQAALRERCREIEQRETGLVGAEEDLQEEWRQWEGVRLGLQTEVEGLENRIRNQRRKLAEQEQALQRPEAGTRPHAADQEQPAATGDGGPGPQTARAAETPADDDVPGDRLAALERLAGDLADQRLHLAEECARLAAARQKWQQDHEAVLADLDATGQRLGEREQALAEREQALAAGECVLRQRHEEAAHARQNGEGWLARLAVREAAWQGERERLLARVQAQEEGAQRQWEALVELRRRWVVRRRHEMRRLRADHERCESFRRQYAVLWEECFRRRTALEQEERLVAERALAMEQFRLECLGRAPDSAAADKGMERLRRRWAALGAEAERRLTQDRQGLDAELARLQEYARRLQDQAADVARREEDLSGRQAAWEQERTLAATAAARLRQELQSLQAQRDEYERQLTEMRDEMERVARLLIDDGEPAALTVVQAA